MNARQKLFLEFYLGEAGLNATRAAIMAGYKPDNAGQIGFELLKKLEIKQRISERLAIVAMTADETLAQIATIARDTSNRTGARLKALELLCRVHGLFDQNVNLTVIDVDPAGVRATLAARIERIAAASEADYTGANGQH